MKKEMQFIFIIMLLLIFVPLISATEEAQVEKAYSCLESKINAMNCSTGFSFEDKVFSLLATGDLKCQSQVISENLSNQCWPKSSCKVKSTAQAVLALNEEFNTTKAENWLLTQTMVPTDMDWFLEIESSSATTCDLGYQEKIYKISIEENKKISSSNLGNCLTLSTGAYKDYFLLISPNCYNMEFDIQCKEDFMTTLLFKKHGSDSNPLNVLAGQSSSAGGTTTEKVDSFCFSLNKKDCDYEGSLWAAFVLDTLENGASKKYDVSKFMPYLITMMDDNEAFLPESFLYFLTGEFRTELLLKQKTIFRAYYWEESINKYYDTALALWPFYYESPYEKTNSKEWLLDVQQNTGCWNNGNIRDTAFILYSLWPKTTSPPYPPGECTHDNDCPVVSCKDAFCDYGGECYYTNLGCIDNDGCCNAGCVYTTDNDCTPGQNECDSTSDCEDKYVLPSEDAYCSADKTKVYKNDSEWNCVNKVCIIDETPKLEDSCTSKEKCYEGNCLSTEDIPDECETYFDCYGENCVLGECVPYTCSTKDDCGYGESCINEECISDEILDCKTEGYFCMSYINCDGNILYDYSCTGVFECCDTGIALETCNYEGGAICADDESCVGGTTKDVSDTTYGETCCLGGSCEKEVILSSNCVDNDGKCKSSCGSDEEESFLYDCSYGETCCVSKDTTKTSKAWIWILLVLILFSALGIVFRDKLRTQWMKLKDKFGKKKDKKRFEMPLTSHSNPQGRMFSRGILPPSQHRPPMHRPISSQRPLIHKKPEEKPKNDLDDVLKKLKEMGK